MIAAPHQMMIRNRDHIDSPQQGRGGHSRGIRQSRVFESQYGRRSWCDPIRIWDESGTGADSETNPALRGFGLNQWTPRSKIQAWMDQHNVSGKDSDADVQIKMLVDTSKSDWNNFYLDNIEAEGTTSPTMTCTNGGCMRIIRRRLNRMACRVWARSVERSA